MFVRCWRMDQELLDVPGAVQEDWFVKDRMENCL